MPPSVRLQVLVVMGAPHSGRGVPVRSVMISHDHLVHGCVDHARRAHLQNVLEGPGRRRQEPASRVILRRMSRPSGASLSTKNLRISWELRLYVWI